MLCAAFGLWIISFLEKKFDVHLSERELGVIVIIGLIGFGFCVCQDIFDLMRRKP